MKFKAVLLILFLTVCFSSYAHYPKLPVFFLKYNGNVGQEEDVDEEEFSAEALLLRGKDGVEGGLGGRGRKPDAPMGGVGDESFLKVTVAG